MKYTGNIMFRLPAAEVKRSVPTLLMTLFTSSGIAIL